MFKKNRTKELIAAGQPALGIEFMTDSHKLIEIAGWSGFDFIQFDMEHTPYSFSEIEGFVRTAEGVGMTPIVRVPEVTATNIRRVLETGAQGVIVPQVRNAQEVREAVSAMRYAPGGKRGMCTITRAARYNEETWDEYIRWASSEIIFIPIIENEEALSNVDEILAVPGVDAVSFGAGDMGQSMGEGAQGLKSLAVRQALDVVRIAARRHGVPIKAMPTIDENAFDMVESMVRQGVLMVTFDADALVFGRQCHEINILGRAAFARANRADP